MILPKQVVEAASFLEKTKDPRFETMRALITPREIAGYYNGDYQDDTHYEKMWGHLKKHEEKVRGELTTSDWVFDFLNDVIAARQLPQYFYMDIDKRLELIMKLNDLTKSLADLYVENSFFSESCLKKALRREESRNAKNFFLLGSLNVDDVSGADMAQALQSCSDFLINNISSAETITKDNAGIEERMFSFALVKRNEFLYKKPLHQIVSTAKWAIYGVNNAAGTISNMVKRAQEF